MPTTLTPNWQALNQECVLHLQNLIRLDTSNPPGNEIIAARYIQVQLAAEGIPSEVVESAPGRANLRVVLKGDFTTAMTYWSEGHEIAAKLPANLGESLIPAFEQLYQEIKKMQA